MLHPSLDLQICHHNLADRNAGETSSHPHLNRLPYEPLQKHRVIKRLTLAPFFVGAHKPNCRLLRLHLRHQNQQRRQRHFPVTHGSPSVISHRSSQRRLVVSDYNALDAPAEQRHMLICPHVVALCNTLILFSCNRHYLTSEASQGLTRRVEKTGKALDEMLETIIDEHEVNGSLKHKTMDKDFVDMLLSLKNKSTGTNDQFASTFERTNVKAVIVDMIFGAIDTSHTAVMWLMSDLIGHPRVMIRLQKEIDMVIGDSDIVEEAHLSKLDYLYMVVKESLRLHPVAPLSVPHESTDDILIDGYYIPKKSRIIINNWGLGRDPNVWSENADEFIPERFIGSNIDLQGQDFQLIPFGSGRRGCPGMHLGLINIQLLVAQMVHCFDWELPMGASPTELDMDEKFGLTLSRMNHLVAIPTTRSRDRLPK